MNITSDISGCLLSNAVSGGQYLVYVYNGSGASRTIGYPLVTTSGYTSNIRVNFIANIVIPNGGYALLTFTYSSSITNPSYYLAAAVYN